MLAVRIVHEHHRELQLLLLVHGLKPQNTGGGLFASAYHIGNQLSVFGMNHIDKVSAIINDNVRADFDHAPDALHIFFV